MRTTPTRRRNGDGPADFVSSVVDDPSLISIPDSIKWALGSRALALHGGGAAVLPRAYDHLWLITACRSVANLAPDMAPYAGRRGISLLRLARPKT
jgi:hypothetical protein